MFPTHPNALFAAAMAVLVGSNAQAVDFASFNVPISTLNDAPNYSAPNAAETLFYWGNGTGEASFNSTRGFTYTGTDAYRITAMTVAGTVSNTYQNSGLDPAYATSDQAWMADMGVKLEITRGATTQSTSFTLFETNFTGIGSSADATVTVGIGDTQIPNRIVTTGSQLNLSFYMAGGALSFPLPDIVYTSPVNVTFAGVLQTAGTLNVAPNPLVYGAARAGSSTTANLSTTIRNTAGADTLVTGTAGAASAPFSGVGSTFSLGSNATTNVSYGFKALSSLGASTTAVVSNGSAAIATNAGNQTLALQGTTVGPVFNLSGAGVAGATGGTVTFDDVLITKSGSTGPDTNALVVTNAFNSNSVAYANTLTGLTVTGAPITGGGSAAFSGGPTSAVIADDGGTNAFNMAFNPTTGSAAGQAYSASVSFETDVGAALGGDGTDFSYTLNGTAYLATLETAAAPVDFGFVRQGGAAATQTVDVTNITGGGFGLNNVTFGAPTNVSPTPGANFAGVGSANIGALASGATGGRDYTLGADALLAPTTTAQALSGELAVSSDEAADVNPLLSGQAVGPVFDFSGANVDFTDDGTSCGGAVVCGTLDLGTVTPTTAAFQLTIANLFGDLLGLLNQADLTLLNVGFGDAYAQTWLDGTGTFSLSTDLGGTVLGPDGGTGPSSATAYLDFSSTDPGLDTGFAASLRFLTDVDSMLGVAGTEFRFDIVADWDGTQPTPVPATLALLGLGLAGLARTRKPRK